MKIGIVTLYGNFNYGNRLQNYALQFALERKGHSVTTIAVDIDSNLLKRILKRFIEKSCGRYRIKSVRETRRERTFDRFTKKHISTHVFHTTDGKIPEKVNLDYDAFCVGSDQVWNPLFWRDADDSSDLYNYFLSFSHKTNISYAASFGVDSISETWQKRMRPLLQRFGAVSVREASGCKITEGLGVNAELVLDPTLLVDVNEWRKLERNAVTEEKYILTYFLGEQPDYVNSQIKELSHKMKAPVINLYDSKNKYYGCGPEVFLELIDRAEVVITDSFHAAVFSILFHTKFAVFRRYHANQSDMSSRIKTLLSTIGIEGGLSEKTIVINDICSENDKLLDVERKKSLSFLDDAL